MAADSSLPNGVSTLINSHEDRLQRVEEAVNSCAVAVAECKGEVAAIGDKVEAGFATLGKRLDHYNGLQEKHADMDGRLRHLEAKAKAKVKRVGAIKGAGYGVLLTGLGAAAAKFGEDLIRALFRAH